MTVVELERAGRTPGEYFVDGFIRSCLPCTQRL